LSERSEVIHCPNCQEDVPKTLYCLNCGYPLYKLQPPTQPKEEAPKEEEEVEMTVEIAPPVEVGCTGGALGALGASPGAHLGG